MVDTLLKYKANPNTKNNTLGRTPLHLAYDGGHQTIAELLEANGALQDQKDNVGKTPLEYSAQNFSSTQKCHDTEQSLSTTSIN
jgi:ankyrin repeat protein